MAVLLCIGSSLQAQTTTWLVNGSPANSCNCEKNPDVKVKINPPSSTFSYDRVVVKIFGSKNGEKYIERTGRVYDGAQIASAFERNAFTVLNGKSSDFNLLQGGLIGLCGMNKVGEEAYFKVLLKGYRIVSYEESYNEATKVVKRTPIYDDGMEIYRSSEVFQATQSSTAAKKRNIKNLIIGAFAAVGTVALVISLTKDK